MARNQGMAVAEIEEVVVSGASPMAGRATDWGAIIGGALGAIGCHDYSVYRRVGIRPCHGRALVLRQPGSRNFRHECGDLAHRHAVVVSGFRRLSRWTAPRKVGRRPHGRSFVSRYRPWTARLGARHGDRGRTIHARHRLAGTAAVVTEGAPAEASAAATAQAREIAANFSIFTAISLLVGAFIGAVAGGLGGYHRDAP